MPSARPRHPLTGKRFWIRARSDRELAAYLHRLDTLRTELKLGAKTPEQVDRDLRNLQHGPVTLERACNAYLERPDLSRRTRERIRAAMRNHLAGLLAHPLAALDAPLLSKWIRSLKLHPTSAATEWRGLRMVVTHAIERGWIGALPWGTWRPKLSATPKRPQREAARSVLELLSLLGAARELDLYDRSFLPMAPSDSEPKIACAGFLALRQGELAGLRWTDIEWGPPVRVLVARQWDGQPLKNGARPKVIESVEWLGMILGRYRDHLVNCHMYDPAGPVFPSRRSVIGKPAPYTRGEVLTRLQLRSAVERANLPRLASWSAHSLRDTFVTLETIASGGDLARVASRSRHGSIATLARYVRAVTRDPAPPPLLVLADERGSGAAPNDEQRPNKEP